MENSQTTTPHTTSSVAVPQPSTLEGHHHNILVEDHHRGSSGGRTFLKSTTAATSSSSPSSNPSSNINNNSGSNNNNNNTNSSSSVTTPSTRRTRHRVDAGEPRGCFNNYYSPRNIFQNSSPISSSNSHSNNNNNNNIPGSIQANSNNLSNSLVVGNSITGAADYYFQPMKMLSDFIGNSHSHFNNHNSTTAASQLLLREMLQKKKIGYEDDVSEIREREREIQSSEESIGCSSGVTNNNNNNNNLTNNNDEIKINGCKNKRKLYQPQKSEFDDDQEEYKDLDDDIDMEYKNNHSADEDDEIMLKSPMAPLTRQLLTCERKQIPRSILQSWKENFKSTLMTHINELVDSQFNVLFGSIGNNSLPHSQNNSQPPHHPQPQHNSQTQQQQQQQQLQHLHHHHHSNPHPPTSRQQSITPPPSTGSAGSVPTGSQDMMGASTKSHLFNGGGSILLSENEKLRMRFQSGYRPQTGYSQALAGLAANNNRDVYEDDGPLSLVVTPKKKRHKVTDTRLTPRAVSRLLGNGSSASDHYLESTPSPRPQMPSPPVAVPISLPTSVAIPNPSLTESRHLFAPYAPLFGPVRSSLDSPPTMLPHHAMMNPVDYVQQLREISAAQQQAQREHQREQAQQATIMKRERGGGSPGSPDSGDTTGESFDLLPGVVYGPGHSSSTLTPMHLRKAKLMFFWVRYPSSAVLKMYFPDIKFNKNNTAQLVKWFSNFREFYYIQMEKYARQALSEGIKIAEDIHVSTDNELYRVLNLHYNRNNHIEVPTNFRFVVEQTLREFFKAIQSGKDSEQSWKKAIYKIIARLDDPVPEYFKSPNFLEQLE